jgi:hypothetical protein
MVAMQLEPEIPQVIEAVSPGYLKVMPGPRHHLPLRPPEG